MINLNANINIINGARGDLTSAKARAIGGGITDLSGILGKINSSDYYSGNAYSFINIKGKDLQAITFVFEKNEYPNLIQLPLMETINYSSWQTGSATGQFKFTISLEDLFDDDLASMTIADVTIVGRMSNITTNTITPTYSYIQIDPSGREITIDETIKSYSQIKYTIEILVADSGSDASITFKPTNEISNVVFPKTDDVWLLIWDTSFVIKGILLTEKLEYIVEKINNKSISCPRQDRSDFELPSYGLISSKGELNIVDYSGEIRKYISSGVVDSNTIVDISIINTLTLKKEYLNSFYAERWEYDDDNFTAKTSLHDALIRWQNIDFLGMPLQSRSTGLDIYNYLKSKTPSEFEFEDLDNETLNAMSSTIFNKPYIQKGSLWSAYNKLCQVCALHIFIDKNKVVTKHLF